MTCISETKEAEKHYTCLQFVEFLELIARVAHLKFSAEHGAPEEVVKQDLSQKIDNILE